MLSRNRVAAPVSGEQTAGLLGKFAAHRTPFALASDDGALIVIGRLMTQPGDDRGLGALLEGNPTGAGDRPTADRHGMGGDRLGEAAGQCGVQRGETEKCLHRPSEVLGIVRLFPRAAGAAGFEFAGVGGIGAFGREIRAQSGEPIGRGPDAQREHATPLALAHDPARTVGLDASTEGGIAGREQGPPRRDGEDLALQTEDVARLGGKGTDFEGSVRHFRRDRAGLPFGRKPPLREPMGFCLCPHSRLR